MSDTKIEWTDRTWNPVTGCTKVSPGCDRCYAEGIARRFAGGKAFPNGFDVTLHPERIEAPLRWRKPARVFVNSMSDLFHDDVPDEFIARVFAVMTLTPQHTYQLLTKRHGRMRSLLSSTARDGFAGLVTDVGYEIAGVLPWERGPEREIAKWPVPNVWLGVSVEDQKRADLRIPALLDTPAAVRFLSCEPLLGPVDLRRFMRCDVCKTGHKFGPCDRTLRPVSRGPLAYFRPDWVIVGGESGPGARPMHPDWARELRDQCTAAGVPFFFKQWGAHLPMDHTRFWGGIRDVTIAGEWSLHDRGRTDGAVAMVPCRGPAKERDGRTLDGRTWDEYPTAETA